MFGKKKVIFFAVFESKYGKHDRMVIVENPTEKEFLEWIREQRENIKKEYQSSGVAVINSNIIKL